MSEPSPTQHPTAQHPTAQQPVTGVIHDIGYRRYTGPRDGDARIAFSLYVTALKHAYGLGRSGRSKVLPFLLLGLTLLPAVIMVGVVAMFGFDEQVRTYAAYTNTVQVLVSIFAASQAPTIFSRDLRSRSIVLYLARPLSARTSALVRWAALATACLIFILAPQLVLYVGGLLSRLDAGDETLSFLKALPLDLLLAAMLASITGLIASMALRRGFAVVGSILAVLVVSTALSAVQAIAAEFDSPRTGEISGLFSPWALVNGLASVMDAGVEVITPPQGAVMVSAYVLAALLMAALPVLALVARFRKAGR
ncbi:ABC transporter permease [Nocardioides gilvus]|uniref:ABC transporter permease n=1 Tax=Nocardioides gilvus TaxID=1735589 RepID=UPI000D74574A|nr:ABC transporter permease [Nocardioides gilvus]